MKTDNSVSSLDWYSSFNFIYAFGIRLLPFVKALLRLAAERERRSAASMVEVLVLDYAKSHSLAVPDPDSHVRKGSTKAK